MQLLTKWIVLGCDQSLHTAGFKSLTHHKVYDLG
jgi:hypothetical protein